MTIETKYIHNVATGEITIEPLTQDEITARAAEYAAELAELASKKAKEEESRLLKISAYEKLGLTKEEIEALVPTPEGMKVGKN
jgi:hypothetical protein